MTSIPNLIRSTGFRFARTGAAIALASFAAAAATGASAQTYPARQIRLIVPSPPGGSNDIVSRLLAQKMSERIGQTMIVENRPGGDNVIGGELVAHSAPDGYTLLFISSGFSMLPATRKIPFDPVKSLVPISQVGHGPNAVYAAPSLPANNIQELIAMAKVKPGAVRFAWGGLSNRFSGELFNSVAGVNMTHVPYKGGGPSLIDVMAGRVEVGFGSLTQTLPHARSGKLKVLGVSTQKRSPLLPDVPTIAESGLPGYDDGIWWGVLGPAGIAESIVTRLNTEIGAIMKDADMVKRLADQGAEPVIAPPEAFAKMYTSQIAKWARVAKEAGIRSE